VTEWTFITKHAVALSLISRRPKITALELGKEMGITERAVRKIIANLSAEGYIKKKREGRGVRYRINPDLTLRQSTHREVAVGDLLSSLGWRKKKSDKSTTKEN
jgi:predicted ArsR family transcriptional regulator